MGMSGYGGGSGYAAGQPPKSKKRPAWLVGGLTVLSFVALLYVIEIWDNITGHRLDDNGIRPLESDGLWGIVFAPMLHSNWDHLIANTVPALVLGFLMTLAGLSRFIYATAIVWILGGLGTWLIGNIGAHCPYVGVRCETNHIGASGLIFGWLAFLIVFGFFTRKVWEIVVGVIVLFVYGGVLLGVLPGTPGVSWQGHLCGAVAGVVAAYLLSKPERAARERRKTPANPYLTS
ncbi:rhomboid family intramembrane serine protease [Mycolicibacterium arseniciresistens]|uniref:Rhomboid family intramembrane serine protease n=1 Tax=Mycolicibacterium arseniciresistens TaxID=3062257 RepID=A0ABT8UEL1_9MYCO|nr:rhomboid family intramembrane serine protease [Mycolicibacterium arseniciresistens]MDO3636219.1 rhomboid family intramembrane serine protease [Mycolicibacterium arseniciresistens]